MATNEFATALDVLRRTRIEAVLTTPLWDDQKKHDWLAAALDTLAEGVKAEAALWEQYKKKGWQSTKTSLLFAAGKLSDLAKEADEFGSKPMPTDEEGNRLRDPGRGIEPGGDPGQEGVAPRAPIASPYAQPRGNDTGEPDEAAIEEHMIRLEAERGEPVAPSAESLAIFDDAPVQPIHDEVHTEVREAMAAEDPFSDPVSAVRLAKPLTYADLMRAIPPRADVPHWSYSQLSTLDDCGVKYAATKMLDMPQVPQWANVGGKAFHAAVELIERRILAPGSEPDNWASVPEIWSTAFSTAIAEQAAEAPVPPAQWRAAAKGAEGFDWWRVEGERMLIAYVEWRRKLIDAAVGAGIRPRELLTSAGQLILEAELKINVPGQMGDVPFVSVLDQAWALYDRNNVVEGILIVDVKTGKSQPVDTFQLGSQALVLAQHMGLGPDIARKFIKACYYDARKAIFTEAFSPVQSHPYEELVYRVHTAEYQRRTGVYRPRVSFFCGSCPVKYACPLQNGQPS